MNYFKHHIGDYDAHTAHLTWLEDMAYTRLMRLYYRTEKPVPSDIQKACRLVRAVSKQERDAVALVLDEFFILEDDGWHNKRCDEEIFASHAKAEANRDNGKKGGRPPKDKTQEKPTGFSVGSDSVATPNPQETLANSHKPLANNQEPQHPPTPLEKGERVETEISPETRLAIQLRNLGVNVTSMHPTLCQWVNAGITDAEAQEAVLRARQNKPPPAQIPPGYLDPIIAQVIAERGDRAKTTSPGTARRVGNAGHQDFDNSAPGKVRRAIEERNARREAEGSGSSGNGIVIDGEFARTAP